MLYWVYIYSYTYTLIHIQHDTDKLVQELRLLQLMGKEGLDKGPRDDPHKVCICYYLSCI